MVVDAPTPVYTREEFERAISDITVKIKAEQQYRADARYYSLLRKSQLRIKALEADNRRNAYIIDCLLDDTNTTRIQLEKHLENYIDEAQGMSIMEGMEMKKAIDRRIRINGKEQRIRANSEEEYAQKVHSAMGETDVQKNTEQGKHLFNEYAKYWFNTFSKGSTAQVTAITYERQLTRHLFPAFDGKCIEDIKTADVQKLFNAMKGRKETKLKCKNVLNMILELAIEEELIQKNPLKSRSFRISGEASESTVPYSVEQMRCLVTNIEKVKRPMDRAFIALQAVHPLRLEETLGLRWKDIDSEVLKIHVCNAVTHPDRNQPVFKETKTEGSRRILDLAPQVAKYLERGKPDEFVIGGTKPISYTTLRKMCFRIKKDTNFSENISPRRFRTTVLTDLYDATKDVKQVQDAAGHTTAAMTFKHYVKGRSEKQNTAVSVANTYGLT